MLAVHPVVLGKDLLDFERDAVLRERYSRFGAIYARGRVKQLQADEILPRIEHAVAVIDTNTRNHSLGQQAAEHAMSSSEDARVFHAQADQIVDIEEAAVIDLFAGNAPVRKPVHLEFQQQMQKVEAMRLVGVSVDVLKSALQQLLHWR